ADSGSYRQLGRSRAHRQPRECELPAGRGSRGLTPWDLIRRGKREDETRTTAGPVLRPNPAAVGFYETSRDGEPEAGPARAARGAAIAIEGIEQSREGPGGQAGSAIGDLHLEVGS